MAMDFNPFPKLEAALYRRSDEQSSSPPECHNHILQGSYLRYIKRSLRPKDIGKSRLQLVQGTLRGRLKSIRLHPGSTVAAVTTAGASGDFAKYDIHVSGTDDCKIRTILGSQEVKWVISFPSEEVQQKWLAALKNACDFAANWPVKEEIERLKDLAQKMKSNVDARVRFHRFKLIPRCFVGRRAIRWIVKSERCTAYQATIIGQKMLNLGLFQHITNEHVFCNKKLLYQFSNSADVAHNPKSNVRKELAMDLLATRSSSSTLLESAVESSQDDRATMRKMSMNAEELVQALLVSNQSLVSVQLSLTDLQANFSTLEDLVNQSIHSNRKAVSNQTKNDYITAGFQFSLLIYFVGSYCNFEMLATAAFFVGLALMVVSAALLKRGLGAFYPKKRTKGFQVASSSNSDALRSVLLKMSVALHLGKDQLPIPIESLDPFFDADYVSDGSDIDIDIEEMDAEDFDSEDCSDEDEDYDDDEREHGDDEDEDDRDIDDCDYVDDDDDQPNTEEQTERLTSEKEKKKENKYENRNESNNENDNEKKALSPDQKSALMSSEKSIMKPCMWPNYPLLLKRSKTMLPTGISLQDVKRLSAPLHIHQPGEPEISEFAVESDLFIGKAFVIVADLHDSPPYFNRKERKFEAVFQGRFKKAIPFAHVFTGQAYDTPIDHIPAKWLVNAALQFMTRLQPAHQVRLEGDHPYILSPLASTAQKIVISKPGQEPSISYGIDALVENMALLDPIFNKMNHRKRKAHFMKRENLNGYTFDPELVYTFDLYQHRLNLSTFKVDLGFVKYDIRKMMGCRPVQIMAVEWIPSYGEPGAAKSSSSPKGNEKEKVAKDSQFDFSSIDTEWKFIYNIEIWHKRCVPKGNKKVSIASPESSSTLFEKKNDTPLIQLRIPTGTAGGGGGGWGGTSTESSPFFPPTRSHSISGILKDSDRKASVSPPPKSLRPTSASSYHSSGPEDSSRTTHKGLGIMNKLRSGSGDGDNSFGLGMLHRSSSITECFPSSPSTTSPLRSTPTSKEGAGGGGGTGIAYSASSVKKSSASKTSMFRPHSATIYSKLE